ncbi:MAG: hypothetical protein AB7V48_07060 [Sedimentibacter sp.]
METPLKNIPLKLLCKKPIMLDANVLMVGIEKRSCDETYSFERMKKTYLIPLFESFEHIIIHEMVYLELDQDCKDFINRYSAKIDIVSEGGLYGKDPQYTTIFNNISNHERVQYDRRMSKNRGEVYSLAYAAFCGINYFSSKEIMVDDIANDLAELKGVQVITFDIIVLLAFIYHNNNDVRIYNKALKSIYKRYCEDVIKRHKLPHTLAEYITESMNYI